MELTRGQERGLRIAVENYRNGERYTCIAGYSGSGKSTLIKYIVAALNLPSEAVAYVAYTGKAAKVLQSKGCKNATTAHKLLYNFKLLKNGTFICTPKEELPPETKLVVVDEISMLPANMWELLLSHGVHVIACGDPF